MLIDHLVYACPDLATTVADIEERFGIRAEAGGRHVGLGTHNALLALGSQTYLEIIAPDPEQASPVMPRPFGLDKVSTARLAGWALATDDIDRAVARARKYGYDPGDAIAMQRIGPTGTGLRWRLTVNSLEGGLLPFFIDWGASEHPARTAPRGLILESFVIEHPDPRSIKTVLAALGSDVEVRSSARPALAARIHGPDGTQELR